MFDVFHSAEGQASDTMVGPAAAGRVFLHVLLHWRQTQHLLMLQVAPLADGQAVLCKAGVGQIKSGSVSRRSSEAEQL